MTNAQPAKAPIVAPTVQQPSMYKSAGGNSHATALTKSEDWKEGVTIDQITHGIYLNPEIMTNGVADELQTVTDALRQEEVLPCGITGYRLPSGQGGGSYLVRLGIKHGKHQLGTLCMCPLHGYANLPFIRIETYTGKIQRLNLVTAYEAYLKTVISSAVTPYIYGCRVSRLDFALDVMVNSLDYLWFGVGVRSHLQFEGKTPTWYLGGEKSPWRFRIYNKKIQFLTLPLPVHIAQPYMLRVELSLGNGKGIPGGKAAKLALSKNPWLKIHPIRVTDIPLVIKECQDPAELAKVVDMGLHAYLKTFGTGKRQAISKKLRALAAPTWWKPVDIWQECLARVSDTPFVTLS
jgi:hypothetical protein